MQKIEFIWRHLLDKYLESRQSFFRQQDLAARFHLSSSTVNLAVKPLRELGAIKVGGRGFEILNPDKILYHWASHHRLVPQIQLRVNLPILEIEGRLPDGTIPTAYTAVREHFGEPPADYDKVHCYHPHPTVIASRFETEIIPGPSNLFILQSDSFLSSLSLSQLFVDLWQLSDWYSTDFVNLVKSKINELLP